VVFCRIVSSPGADETILAVNETVFRLGSRTPETANGYQACNNTAGSAGGQTGDRQMRTLSFLLAFAFMAVPSMAGSTDTLPGIGTFAYNGPPIAIAAPQSLVVAAR
jgi:hypothetical protein